MIFLAKLAKNTGAEDATSPWRKSVFADFFSKDFTNAFACGVEAYIPTMSFISILTPL